MFSTKTIKKWGASGVILSCLTLSPFAGALEKRLDQKPLTCFGSGNFEEGRLSPWRWGAYFNITEEITNDGKTSSPRSLLVSGHVEAIYHYSAPIDHGRRRLWLGGPFDSVKVSRVQYDGMDASVPLFKGLDTRVGQESIEGRILLTSILEDGTLKKKAYYSFQNGDQIGATLPLSCFERNPKRELSYTCIGTRYDDDRLHIIEKKTPQGLRQILAFGHAAGATFIAVERTENPDYRPRKYKGYSQFGDFDGTLGDVWGQLVIDSQTKFKAKEKNFKAHYIYQAGDHYGGTLHLSCSAAKGVSS
ncbi:MAG: hypothetical protein OXB88_06795 [Bacteriovoracales bacterium]|nr:hypothetical protein [Bacteriovoracales bacterium]